MKQRDSKKRRSILRRSQYGSRLGTGRNTSGTYSSERCRQQIQSYRYRRRDNEPAGQDRVADPYKGRRRRLRTVQELHSPFGTGADDRQAAPQGAHGQSRQRRNEPHRPCIVRKLRARQYTLNYIVLKSLTATPVPPESFSFCAFYSGPPR